MKTWSIFRRKTLPDSFSTSGMSPSLLRSREANPEINRLEPNSVLKLTESLQRQAETQASQQADGMHYLMEQQDKMRRQ